MAVSRRHVWVGGRVQGVWFRGSCAERARTLGISGWVTNRADGRVEAVFEGDSTTVSDMVAWCYHGPDAARVTNVEVVSEPPESLAGFRVIG